MSKTFKGIVCFVFTLFLVASTLISQYNLGQVNELSAMQQETMGRDIEIIASQRGYIADLEEALEFLIPVLANEDVEATE